MKSSIKKCIVHGVINYLIKQEITYPQSIIVLIAKNFQPQRLE